MFLASRSKLQNPITHPRFDIWDHHVTFKRFLLFSPTLFQSLSASPKNQSFLLSLIEFLCSQIRLQPAKVQLANIFPAALPPPCCQQEPAAQIRSEQPASSTPPCWFIDRNEIAVCTGNKQSVLVLPAEGLQREGIWHYLPTAFKRFWGNWYFEPLLVLCSAAIFDNYNKLSVKIKSQSADQSTVFIMYYPKAALLPIPWLFSKNRGMESEQLKDAQLGCAVLLYLSL